MTEKDLEDFVNERVIDYKKIRGGISFQPIIPRNNVGKLLRNELTQWAEANVSSI